MRKPFARSFALQAALAFLFVSLQVTTIEGSVCSKMIKQSKDGKPEQILAESASEAGFAVTYGKMQQERFYDSTLGQSVARFLIGNQSNQTNQQIVGDFLMVVGTDAGNLYTFSPRSIQASFTLFAKAQHSSVISGAVLQSSPQVQIQDIKVDYRAKMIFAAVGNEIYAYSYFLQQSAKTNTVTQPIVGSNGTTATENQMIVTSRWILPVLLYAAPVPSGGFGLITSIELDTVNQLMYVADKANSQIVRLDYSGFVQYQQPLTTAPIASNASTQSNLTTVNTNSTSNETNTSSPTLITNGTPVLNATVALQTVQNSSRVKILTLPIQNASLLSNLGALLLDPSGSNLYWANQNGSLNYVALLDIQGQPFTASETTLTPNSVFNQQDSSNFQGLCFAQSNLYMLANQTSLQDIVQGVSLANPQNIPAQLYNQFNNTVGNNALHSVADTLLVVNDQIQGLVVLLLNGTSNTVTQTPIYLSLPILTEKVVAFNVLLMSSYKLCHAVLTVLGIATLTMLI